MNRKRILISFIMLCLVTTFSLTYTYVQAKDFTGQEDKYIQLCSSSKLTDQQQATCQEFNTYLSKKNKELAKDQKDTEKNVQKTQDSIDEIAQQINDLNEKTKTTQKELTYMQNSIETLNQKIANKQKVLEDRMYSMQTTMNSGIFTAYLFGAESFTDFMSRVSNFKQITSYDNEIISELTKNIKEIKKQQETLQILKESLNKDKLAQTDLQNKLTAKLTEQNKELAANNSEISKNQESMESIRDNLAALKKAAAESKVNNVTQATPNKKPSKPNTNQTKPNDSQNNQTNNDQPNQEQPGEDSDQLTSSEELGLKIANKALTRQGYMYVWGGGHSTSSIQNPNWTKFDCSGLVNWAHYQSGVPVGTGNTKTLANSGQSISKDQLQAGDIILFSSNGAFSGIHHVGIYIGNNQMVHAPTEGEPVQVSRLSSSYWQREWYSCRRLY